MLAGGKKTQEQKGEEREKGMTLIQWNLSYILFDSLKRDVLNNGISSDKEPLVHLCKKEKNCSWVWEWSAECWNCLDGSNIHIPEEGLPRMNPLSNYNLSDIVSCLGACWGQGFPWN